MSPLFLQPGPVRPVTPDAQSTLTLICPDTSPAGRHSWGPEVLGSSVQEAVRVLEYHEQTLSEPAI